MNLLAVRYAAYIVFGALILIGTIIVNIEVRTYQAQFIDATKNRIQNAITANLQATEDRIEQRAHGIIAFYKGSQAVEPHEFTAYNEEVAKKGVGLQNILLVHGKQVVQSYPDTGLIGSNSDSLFPSYVIERVDSKSIVVQFHVGVDERVLFVFPPAIMLNTDKIMGDNYKAVLTDESSGEILYEKERAGDTERTEGIVFSASEKESAITINFASTLAGYGSDEKIALKYVIWDSAFERPNPLNEQLILFPGLALSIAVPVLLIRAEKLNIKINKSLEQLKEVDKAKDELLSMVTHELKTPLVPIMSYAEMLMKGYIGSLSEEEKKKVAVIYSNASKLNNMINDLLDVRKLELGRLSFNFERHDVERVVREAVSVLASECEKGGIRLTVNCGNNLYAEMDADRIRQVITNLLTNAIKFVEPGKGTIAVDIRDATDRILFHVRDNGIGIPKDKQKDLFKKFYQVDSSIQRKAGGSGLGLAIAKGIVEAHKGEIWLESDAGAGTTVYFAIPKSKKQAK